MVPLSPPTVGNPFIKVSSVDPFSPCHLFLAETSLVQKFCTGRCVVLSMIFTGGQPGWAIALEPTSQYLRHFPWASQGPQNTFLISCIGSTYIPDWQCSGKGKASIFSVELFTKSLFIYDTLAVNCAWRFQVQTYFRSHQRTKFQYSAPVFWILVLSLCMLPALASSFRSLVRDLFL